jgi:uncharacterized protein (TIGR03086 family)
MTAVAERYGRLADDFGATVRGVRDDQWDAPTPCADWDVRALVAHVTNNGGVFLGLIGEPAPDLPPIDVDLVAAWQVADAAVRDTLADPDRANREYDGYFGRSTFAAAVDSILCFDLIVHRWDLARATGQDETLDPGDVATVFEAAKGFGDSLRSSSVCGPALDPPAGADDQTRLLAFLGRRA